MMYISATSNCLPDFVTFWKHHDSTWKVLKITWKPPWKKADWQLYFPKNMKTVLNYSRLQNKIMLPDYLLTICLTILHSSHYLLKLSWFSLENVKKGRENHPIFSSSKPSWKYLKIFLNCTLSTNYLPIYLAIFSLSLKTVLI